MGWRLAKSLTILRAEVDAKHPKRDKRSDGTIGDRAHASRRSDHNPNSAGVVTAWDCTDDGGTLGMELAEHLRRRRDPRVKYVISEGRMFSSYPASGYPAWTWRPYGGSNQHTTHTHVSVSADPDLYDSTKTWGFYSGLPPAEEEDMSEAVKGIQRALGVTDDGIFGPKTESALTEAMAVTRILGPDRAEWLARTTDDLLAKNARPSSLGHVLLWHRHSRDSWPDPVRPGP